MQTDSRTCSDAYNNHNMGTLIAIVIWVILSIMVGNYAEEHGESKGFFIFIAICTSPLMGYIIAAVNKKY